MRIDFSERSHRIVTWANILPARHNNAALILHFAPLSCYIIARHRRTHRSVEFRKQAPEQ
jgi:hypothetical protein